jgi:hypothetical protein
MDKEEIKTLIKELFISGELDIQLEKDSDGRRILVSILIDNESVSKDSVFL